MSLIWRIGLCALVATPVACSSSDGDPGSESSETDCEAAGDCEGDPPDCEGTDCEDLDPTPGPGPEVPSCSPDSPVGEPCVDAFGAMLCPVQTGFPGDELALCDLGEDNGLAFHYGPRDYDDPDNVDLFLLEPGGEDENCTYTFSRNETDKFVKSYRGRMRPNSHHLILRTESEPSFEETDEPEACDFTGLIDGRWLVGSQDPQIDIAVGGGVLGSVGGDTAPEPGDPDYRLGQRIFAQTPVQIDMHYVNPTEEVILREAWVWFDYVDAAHVDDRVDMITFFQGEIDIPPQGSATTTRAYCEAPTDRYVGLITGHAHEKLTRFSVWHHDSAGGEALVYETYDWAEPGNLFYRDGLDNPVPNAEARAHGGSSGYLLVKQGESLSFECEYFNPTNESVGLGETTQDEMCNVFGMYYPTDGDVWNCTCLGGCF